MLTCGDTETSEEVVDDGPNGSLQLERHPERLDASVGRNANDEEHVQPVDVLVPVLTGHGGIGNVNLLRIRRPRASRLSLGRHGVCRE